MITVFRVVFKVIGYLGPVFPQRINYDSGFWGGQAEHPLNGGQVCSCSRIASEPRPASTEEAARLFRGQRLGGLSRQSTSSRSARVCGSCGYAAF